MRLFHLRKLLYDYRHLDLFQISDFRIHNLGVQAPEFTYSICSLANWHI